MAHNVTRAGYTLIEILVVIVILGMLVGLVLPAVQSTREAARRMECLCRMSQVGFALQGFEGSHKSFPAAHLGFNTTQGDFVWYSPFVYLLPFVDQAVVYNRVNFQKAAAFAGSLQPAGVADHRIATFCCPSDTEGPGCNFRFCTGSSAYSWDFTDASRRNGAFIRHFPQHIRDFSDGLSNTVGVSEKIKSPYSSGKWSPKAQFWYSGVTDFLGYNATDEIVVQACESVPAAPAKYAVHAGNSWLLGFYDFTLYNHIVTPNSPVYDCSTHSGGDPSPTQDADAGVFTARSYHVGGVNCMLMDGSARFVNNSVDLEVWHALATRANGEIIGEF